jgi:hypothetical protein
MVTNKMLNKKGELLSLYWFLILMIVAGGVVGMVYLFYGTPYDVRDIETNLLIDKIANCISYGGRINEGLILNGEKKEFYFIENCHLNFGEEETEFFSEITFYKVEDMENYFLKTSFGNLNLLASCEIQEDKEYKNLPRCAKKSFYSLDNLNNQYIIEILSVVKKSEQNVKK